MSPMSKMSPTSTFALIAVLAAGVLALLGGCGGGDDASSTSSSASTSTATAQPADQLVEQADAICRDANRQRPTAPELDANPSAKELQSTTGYFETDLKVTRDAYDQLNRLAPPEGFEEEWSTVLAGFRSVIGNYPALIDAAKAGDSKAFVAVIGEIQKGATDLPAAAAKIGLRVCGTA